MAPMKRSDVEYSKRVFLDRLTTDNQKLLQPADIDAGPGDDYVYAGVYDTNNLGVGADCSGAAGVFIGIALRGPGYFAGGYTRQFSTESFPGPFDGFRQVSQADLLAGDNPIKVCIHHGGGGPNSHMNVEIDGWLMESNGDHGTCTRGHGAIEQNSSYWNDFWVHDGPIIEDTTGRQAMSYPRGVDYAGGRIPAGALKAAGISFVCRYLTDGGASLPGKQLLGDEFADLRAGGIDVVFNYETTADFMLAGRDAGRADAQAALNYIRSLPGVPADWWPVVYFSADFDEAPNQDQAIFDFCDGAHEVLGAEPGGRRRTGLYGDYWIISRALDAGKVGYTWETEAWSGSNREARANLVQRNGLGFMTVAGVQCDINEAHTDAFGQFPAGAPTPGQPAPPAPPANPDAPPAEQAAQLLQVWDQLRVRWPALRGMTVVEALGEVLNQLKGPGDKGWRQLGRNPDGTDRSLVDGLAALHDEIAALRVDLKLSKAAPAKAPRKPKVSK